MRIPSERPAARLGQPTKTTMKLLICLLTGHRFTPWKLRPVTHRNRLVTDIGLRSCTCCRRSWKTATLKNA